jgi:hypothetical protein
VESGRFSPPSPLQAFGQRFGLSGSVHPALNTELWQPISEVYFAYREFHTWNTNWFHRFGHDIISLIPSNSIYFGGTDPGRFIVTALCDSQIDGRQFFTLTQNQLADQGYLDYLRTMYGYKLYVPTAIDSQNAFKDYLDDARKRLEEQKLKPNEDVRIVDDRLQVSGQVAVMGINALLTEIIVDKNPDQEVFVEESFSLDWMYPHLSPHGLIMKLNRTPLAELDEDTVKRDRDYWNRYVKELIGDWLTEKTSVKEVCEFGEKVFLRKDLAGFAGNLGFVTNQPAQVAYSKLRTSIGGLYAWRGEYADSPDEQKRMRQEADFAFRQALALCPSSPEIVFRYVNLLLAKKRNDDALMVARLLFRLNPEDPNAKELLGRLEKYVTSQTESPK